MHLYHLTVQRPTGITCAAYGSFTGRGKHELLVVRGTTVELVSVGVGGKCVVLRSSEAFGLVRGVRGVRVAGSKRDFAVATSDAGRLSVWRVAEDGSLQVDASLAFGKSGVQRAVPGALLCADPKGRAVFSAAVERDRLAWMLRRDEAEGPVEISSPLPSKHAHTVCIDAAALDVGFDNPRFVALEIDFAPFDDDPTGVAARNATPVLTTYELELGLNSLLRRGSQDAGKGASKLLTVPGGNDGPGGVLVLAEGRVGYHSGDGAGGVVETTFPRRENGAQPGLAIAAVTQTLKGGRFLSLVQLEGGDVFKVELVLGQVRGEAAEGAVEERVGVVDVAVSYFDSLPACSQLCITRQGLLVALCESGDGVVYKFRGLGSKAGEEGVSHGHPFGEVPLREALASTPTYSPRSRPKNLSQLSSLPSCAPTTSLAVADLVGEGVPQLYLGSGFGGRAKVQVLRPGLEVEELASTPLPGVPTGLWTVPRSGRVGKGGAGGGEDEGGDELVVLSFVDDTLVLRVGKELAEVGDPRECGCVDGKSTLWVGRMHSEALVQVVPTGLRVAQRGGEARAAEWRASHTVLCADGNGRQVVLAQSDGSLTVFELTPSGDLREAGVRKLDNPITAISLPPVPDGLLRAPIAIAATTSTSTTSSSSSSSSSLLLLSLDPSSPLSTLATHDCDAGVIATHIAPHPSRSRSFVVRAGMVSGALIALTAAGSGVGGGGEGGRRWGLMDVQSRVVGGKGVRLAEARVDNAPALLALSSRSQLVSTSTGLCTVHPLATPPFDLAAPLRAALCPDGILATAKDRLRILRVTSTTTPSTTTTSTTTPKSTSTTSPHPVSSPLLPPLASRPLPAHRTPKATFPLPDPSLPRAFPPRHLLLLEAERGRGGGGEGGGGEGGGGEEDGRGGGGEEEEEGGDDGVLRWRGCVRVLCPLLGEEQSVGRLGVGEAGVGVAVVRRVISEELAAALGSSGSSTRSKGAAAGGGFVEDVVVVVASAVELSFHPRRARGGVLRAFRVVRNGESEVRPEDAASAGVDLASAAAAVGKLELEELHVTPLEEAPSAIVAFRGKVVVAVGSRLVLFEVGRKQMLRKTASSPLPTIAACITPLVAPEAVARCANEALRVVGSGARGVGAEVRAAAEGHLSSASIPGLDVTQRCSVLAVADAMEGVHLLRYQPPPGQRLELFADEPLARATIRCVGLDASTVATADRHGNIAVLRTRPDAKSGPAVPADERALWEADPRLGAPAKLEQVCHFHVGEVVTALTKAALPGGVECILYATILGRVGALLPLAGRREAEQMAAIERALRRSHDSHPASPIGRSHLAWRGHWIPVQNVVDGDLCETLLALPTAAQKTVAETAAKPLPQLKRKIEALRARLG